jgi:hypothetical protein
MSLDNTPHPSVNPGKPRMLPVAATPKAMSAASSVWSKPARKRVDAEMAERSRPTHLSDHVLAPCGL